MPDVEGPTHRYIGASPGCWAVYGEVLSRDFGVAGPPPEHRLVVDAYAAQHPGTESLPATRSVAGHLLVLHLVLERGLPYERITGATRHFAKRPEFVWLEPPASLGGRTVLDVHGVKERRAYARACREWAESVWGAWSAHHARVRRWASR